MVSRVCRSPAVKQTRFSASADGNVALAVTDSAYVPLPAGW
jgi:hypothetical protein